jgi:hypothetical protein
MLQQTIKNTNDLRHKKATYCIDMNDSERLPISHFLNIESAGEHQLIKNSTLGKLTKTPCTGAGIECGFKTLILFLRKGNF